MSILANRNIIIGMLAMLGGLLYGYYGKAYLSDIPLVTAQSSLYTQSLAWSMGFCGLVNCVMGILEMMREGEKKKKAESNLAVRMRIAQFIVITALTLLLMPYLGFMFTSALAAMAYMYLMHERRWKYMAAVAILFCLALYLMFGVVLSIPFTEFPLSHLITG